MTEIKPFWLQMRTWENLVVLDHLLKVDFFEKIKDGQTATQISDVLMYEQEKFEPILNSLTAQGLLVRDGESYLASPFSQKHLRRKSPDSLVAYINWKVDDMLRWKANIGDVLTGKKDSVYAIHDSYSGDPCDNKTGWQHILSNVRDFVRGKYNPLLAVQRTQMHVDTQGIVEACSRVYPIEEIVSTYARDVVGESVVDLGCGTGEYSFKLLQRLPKLSAQLLDIKPRFADINLHYNYRSLLNRAQVLRFDFSKDMLPVGGNVMVNNVFMDHPDIQVSTLLDKIVANKPARIFVHEFMDEPDAISAGYAVLAVMETTGRLRTKSWWNDRFAERGYLPVFNQTSYGSYCISAKRE